MCRTFSLLSHVSALLCASRPFTSCSLRLCLMCCAREFCCKTLLCHVAVYVVCLGFYVCDLAFGFVRSLAVLDGKLYAVGGRNGDERHVVHLAPL